LKSSRKTGAFACPLLLLAIALHAQLPPYIQHLGAEANLRTVFFRDLSRRPPRETRADLTRRIAASPTDAALYRLRASEAELTLDFSAAEADWKTVAQLTNDSLPLADFYHRRLRPADEIAALDAVATPKAFQRAIDEAEAQLLPVAPQYRAWLAHDPANAALRKRLIRYLTDQRDFAAAESEIRALPADPSNWLEEMHLALRRGTVDQAIAVFDRSFQPAMQTATLKEFFDLLKAEGRLSDFAAQVRAAALARPESLDPVARLFHYFENEENHAAARRALAEYLARKKSWTPEELLETAQLLQRVQDWDQSARQYATLYALPTAAPADRRRALAGLVDLVLTAPEQPIQFGSGDLSLYRDIATMDPHPGFLNGILSLVLNTASPAARYNELTNSATAYFHRAKASELLQVFDTQFPAAPEAPALKARLIDAYASYAENDAVVRAGRAFLSTYPHAPERTRVALLIADAYARQDKTAAEFTVYDELLKETRDQEYVAILDRYIARLVSLRRAADALEVYRHELDRNPHDPALYEKLAAFLDQRNLGSQVEAVYKQAASQFRGTSWDQKLSRWYLRRQRTRDFEDLAARIAQTFSGSELEEYFTAIVQPNAVDSELYVRLNLYAHKRFPDDLAFIKNLLYAYTRNPTANPAAYSDLLRKYWYYDPQLRGWFFEALSRTGKLDGELAAIRRTGAPTDPASAQFLAEGEAWRSHFELAAPPLRTLAAAFPGSPGIVLRASTLERSLGHTESALALARNLIQADPRDREALARAGDTLADRDLFTRARPFWNRIPQTEPGKPEPYLESATIFWDYYKFDDALRLIADARTRLHQPALFAYEAGAIHEGRRDYRAVVKEYIAGDDRARDRLVQLAQTRAHRSDVDAAMPNAPLATRVAVLLATKRLDDLQALLRTRAAATSDAADLAHIQTTAAAQGFTAIEQLAMERQIATPSNGSACASPSCACRKPATISPPRAAPSKPSIATIPPYSESSAPPSISTGAINFPPRPSPPSHNPLPLPTPPTARSSPSKPLANPPRPESSTSPANFFSPCSPLNPSTPPISPPWPTPTRRLTTIAVSAISTAP
jgi:cellulose synthase operon protein C